MTRAPVLFLVFNRPEHTARVFERIQQARPTRLYVAADGPRASRRGERETCELVREVATRVDWRCDVSTLFRADNLGCRRAVSEAISWFFHHEEYGIVLEDDCVAGTDFFGFCDVLLDRYRHDERVWAITGNNFQDGRRRGSDSYYFSKYVHVWGWASWRRAWQHYDVDMPFWPEWRESEEFRTCSDSDAEQRYWANIFERVWRGEIDTWDYSWLAAIWRNGGLTATPNVNLVTNIGVGPTATHTVAAQQVEGIPVRSLGPLTHPADVARDVNADRYTFDTAFGGRNMRGWRRFRTAVKRLISAAVRPQTGRLSNVQP